MDDPPGESQLAVYTVPSDGGPASVVRTLDSSADLSAVHPDGDGTAEIRLAFPLPAGVGAARLSPDGDLVAWMQGGEGIENLDLRQRSLWVAGRGQAAGRRLAIVQGGGLVGWAGDGAGLIVIGRLQSNGPSGVWRLPLDAGEPLLLAEGRRPRGVELSPGGDWVAFYLAFEEDRSRNGVWVAATSGGTLRALSDLASYRWAGDERLLYIPFDLTDESLTLMALDPAGGGSSVWIPAPAFPGGIAANDWLPSPSGDRIVYRSAADGRLWIVARSG